MTEAADVFAYFTTPRQASTRDPAETALLSQGQRSTVPYRGCGLAAWTWGEGVPVLMVHGWESRASNLGAIIQALCAAGFRVTAYDAPAHGESDGRHSDPVDFGRAVLAVQAELGPFRAVVAHSVGSAGVQYALAHGFDVDAGVHIAGPASLDRALRRLGRMAGMPDEAFPELRRLVEERIGASLESMQAESLRAGMTHPALLLHDPEDRQVPFAESEALAAAWSRSTLQPVPGAGHARILGEPAVVSQIAGFLEAVVMRDELPSSGVVGRAS